MLGRGFSLLEILLTMALISLLMAVAVPAYQSVQTENDVSLAVATVTGALRQASASARAVNGGTSWGVAFSTSSLTLFKGPSFVGRDSAADELFSISKSLRFSGVSEIVFAPVTGFPAAPATSTIITNNQKTRDIVITSFGTLAY